jgi:hypothetical protein
MAGLISARPIVTTAGALTEPIWAGTRSVALVPADDLEEFVASARTLLADGGARALLGTRAGEAYRAHFAMEHTIARLRLNAAGTAA